MCGVGDEILELADMDDDYVYELTFNLPEDVYLLWVQWQTRSGLMTGDKSDEVALQFALTEVLKITEEFVN